jgi:hypothetical protein
MAAESATRESVVFVNLMIVSPLTPGRLLCPGEGSIRCFIVLMIDCDQARSVAYPPDELVL